MWKSIQSRNLHPTGLQTQADVVSLAVADGLVVLHAERASRAGVGELAAHPRRCGALFDRGWCGAFTPACVIAWPLAKPSDQPPRWRRYKSRVSNARS